MNLLKNLSFIGSCTLRVLYPLSCPICGELLELGEEGAHSECLKKLPYDTEHRCRRCPNAVESDEDLCISCQKHPKSFRSAVSAFSYEDVRESVLKLKYHHAREYADFFAEQMVQRCAAGFMKYHPDALVPVPLHPVRMRQRGYNQAELLANSMGKIMELPVRNDAVLRVKQTVRQKSLGAAERAVNLRQAFAAGNTAGLKTVILVDDIYTTGNTADAVTRCLLEEGVQNVYVVTAAAGSGK